jgi:hypothetical protein
MRGVQGEQQWHGEGEGEASLSGLASCIARLGQGGRELLDPRLHLLHGQVGRDASHAVAHNDNPAGRSPMQMPDAVGNESSLNPQQPSVERGRGGG